MSNKIRCSNAECESRTNEEDCPPAFDITVSVDENTELKNNRLALLQSIQRVLSRTAELTRIVVDKAEYRDD